MVAMVYCFLSDVSEKSLKQRRREKKNLGGRAGLGIYISTTIVSPEVRRTLGSGGGGGCKMMQGVVP